MISALVAELAIFAAIKTDVAEARLINARVIALETIGQYERIPLLLKREAIDRQIAAEKDPSKNAALLQERAELVTKMLVSPTEQEVTKDLSELHVKTEDLQDKTGPYYNAIMWSSLGLFCFGGLMWYFRQQKPSDRRKILENQLLELQIAEMTRNARNPGSSHGGGQHGH